MNANLARPWSSSGGSPWTRLNFSAGAATIDVQYLETLENHHVQNQERSARARPPQAG
jgi:hypothetical protein